MRECTNAKTGDKFQHDSEVPLVVLSDSLYSRRGRIVMGEETENFSDARDLLARIRLLSLRKQQAWRTNEKEHRDEERCMAHVTPF